MYSLKFISGKYQGGEFPLRTNKQIVVGRSSDLDMVLVEDMVSRKHAKIFCQEGKVVIEDLGSTNGTFVNGEKVRQARLKEGDRILIGTSILKLVSQTQSSAPAIDDLQIKQNLEKAAAAVAARQTRSSSMAGKIEEVPLPDLLQLFGTSKKSGVLHIREEHDARIYLRQGKIYYAVIDDNHELGPLKSFFRIVHWERGDFELMPPSKEEFMVELEDTTEALLMDGLRQLDEIRRIESELPEPDDNLTLASTIVSLLRDLSPEQLDILQLVHNEKKFQIVLDKALGSDLDTCLGLVHLLKSGYVTVVR